MQQSLYNATNIKNARCRFNCDGRVHSFIHSLMHSLTQSIALVHERKYKYIFISKWRNWNVQSSLRALTAVIR